MIKRLVAAFLAVSMAALCACGDEQVIHEQAEQTEITLSWWGNDARHEYTLAAVNKFQEKYPYIKVKWGQYFPEGEYCPNDISGCTNTALGQIMSFYNYPTQITLTYAEADISTQSLNWSNIKGHNTRPLHSKTSLICNSSDAHKAIGRLMRQLGELNNSDYTNSNSTSTSSQTYAHVTMSNLGFTTGSWDDYDGSSVRNQLDAQHLLLVRGQTSGGNGHAWVIDGYLEDREADCIVEKINTSHGEMLNIIEVISQNFIYYNHINWGWYGDNNGYFSDGVFNTISVLWPDTSNNSGGYNLGNSVRFVSIYH